eukprot:scaffold200290_cov18-Tisochrysis_lutea.AAC.1
MYNKRRRPAADKASFLGLANPVHMLTFRDIPINLQEETQLESGCPRISLNSITYQPSCPPFNIPLLEVKKLNCTLLVHQNPPHPPLPPT